MEKSSRRRKKVPLSTMITSDGTKVQERRLFITHKNAAKAISLDRLRKDLRWTMEQSSIPDSWTPHSLRGASASKCINLGLDQKRVLDHGRWTSFQTFRKHYLRTDFFKESSSSNCNLPIWKALRTPVTSIEMSSDTSHSSSSSQSSLPQFC
jgi:hypothetical protein